MSNALISLREFCENPAKSHKVPWESAFKELPNRGKSFWYSGGKRSKLNRSVSKNKIHIDIFFLQGLKSIGEKFTLPYFN